MLLKPSLSSPSPWFHSLAATAGVRKKKKKKRERAMWRQANLKAIIDHQPPWLVWLQCARCNWLGRAIRSFNRKYTLSLSISFKKWQHREETQLPEATVSYKNWIHCRRHSNAESYNQTKRFCAKLYLQSGLRFTAAIIWAYWASCCFLPIAWNQHQKELNVLCFSKTEFMWSKNSRKSKLNSIRDPTRHPPALYVILRLNPYI